jgi:hypothetical protein
MALAYISSINAGLTTPIIPITLFGGYRPE